MSTESLVIPAAYLMDLLLGDPQISWHPVRLIGRLIAVLEKRLNYPGPKRKIRGVILLIATTSAVILTAWGILGLSALFNRHLFYAVSVVLVYFSISTKSLAKEANKIGKSLKDGSVSRARNELSMIVGRDTENLDENGIIRATVETVAESTMDGIVAPLFYAFLGGPLLAWFYKTVNTLDSMVGYKNERFSEFGWASARLDGLLNFIPARITAFLISAAVFLRGRDWRASVRWAAKFIFKGPGSNSDSPEAAMAGGLGVQLGGLNFYSRLPAPKPLLGNTIEPLCTRHVRESVAISYLASFLMLAAGWLAQRAG
ncbi:MAG: adenosylcobinamide-phosphate synthase CbiB [Candidatus Omnitrophota bacterium]